MGREADGLRKDPVPEPHHTYHTMGETHQVHLNSYCTQAQLQFRTIYTETIVHIFIATLYTTLSSIQNRLFFKLAGSLLK